MAIKDSELRKGLDTIWENFNMENVEITVKVNGKEVPLGTISTETFEGVKEAIKEPEYSGVLVGELRDVSPRVFFRVTPSICECVGSFIALTRDGDIYNRGNTFKELFDDAEYTNIRQLGD